MKNNAWKCPYCGSTHFFHTFPKNKEIPVFLITCNKCHKDWKWIYKKDYYSWINGNVEKICFFDVRNKNEK